MLGRNSWIFITDGTNIYWIKIFHLYGGFCRSITYDGFYTKGTARVVKPPIIEYKGFKRKSYFRGNVCRQIIVRTSKISYRRGGFGERFFQNAGIIVRLKGIFRSKYHYGPVFRRMRRKRLIAAFPISL